jgi:hypothetical protein
MNLERCLVEPVPEDFVQTAANVLEADEDPGLDTRLHQAHADGGAENRRQLLAQRRLVAVVRKILKFFDFYFFYFFSGNHRENFENFGFFLIFSIMKI